MPYNFMYFWEGSLWLPTELVSEIKMNHVCIRTKHLPLWPVRDNSDSTFITQFVHQFEASWTWASLLYICNYTPCSLYLSFILYGSTVGICHTAFLARSAFVINRVCETTKPPEIFSFLHDYLTYIYDLCLHQNESQTFPSSRRHILQSTPDGISRLP